MGINAEYMGLHPETMATPEHQARIDAARKPPYEMEGAPTSTTQITSPAPATVEKYANGDQKTVADDGDITHQRWHGYHVFHGWQSGASHAERCHPRSRNGWQQA